MSPLLSFLILASRKSAKLLFRDYFELEQIQSSVRPATDFVLKSEKKVRELLLKELLKYPNSSISESIPDELRALLSEDTINKSNVVKVSSERGRFNSNIKSDNNIYFVIHPIDGIDNLTRAIPFFATIIIAYEYRNSKLSALATVINMPALGEIIYSYKGSGVLMERNIDQNSDHAVRLRPSMTNKIEQAVIISDYYVDNIYKQKSIGCDIYGVYTVISGKSDVFLSKESINTTVVAASEILIKESGSASYHNKTFNDNKYKFIASNGKILI